MQQYTRWIPRSVNRQAGWNRWFPGQNRGYRIWSSITLREALKEKGINIAATTASIQGFGNVAQYAARLYSELGGKAIAVSCWNHVERKPYTFRKKDGINVDELCGITDMYGGIDKSKAQDLNYEVLEGGAWLEQEEDIIISAALQDHITVAKFVVNRTAE